MLRPLLALLCFLMSVPALRAGDAPDTVRVGIYITSVHDIDFREKEYAINFWLWFTCRNPEFNFLQNVEVPQAKSITKSYAITDTLDDGRISTLMKVQCVMRDSWRISNFPFDRQTLRMSVENAQYDSRFLIFAIDTFGDKHYDPKFTISGWHIDSFSLNCGIKTYETSFGDLTLDKPHAEYAAFKVRIGIQRDPWGLFCKIFLGMYISFLIAFVCFFIRGSHFDSRFSLSVGALFAAIGNKYVIDSSLPESTSFTLVDTLHTMTLFFILVIISSSVLSLRFIANNRQAMARNLDIYGSRIILLFYLLLNVWLIYSATN